MTYAIPVQVRVARTEHACGHCGGPIQPGEQYEDYRLPPYREPNESEHWWVMKVHHGITNGYSGYGCDVAAAYREKAEREQRAASAPCGSPADLNHCPHCPVHHAGARACPRSPGCPGCYPWSSHD